MLLLQTTRSIMGDVRVTYTTNRVPGLSRFGEFIWGLETWK